MFHGLSTKYTIVIVAITVIVIAITIVDVNHLLLRNTEPLPKLGWAPADRFNSLTQNIWLNENKTPLR